MTDEEIYRGKPSDQVYRHLFSNPVLIRDTIAGFVGGDLADMLDFASLEQINPNYVSDRLARRSNDMVWRIQWLHRDDWMYLLFILEFQSSRHRFMPVRILTYTSLLYEHLIDQDKMIRQRCRLPPVLPIVWYSGENQWDSPISMAALRPPNLSATLLKYQPNMEFFLVNDGCYNVGSSDSFAALVVAVKQCKTPDALAVVCSKIDEKLKGPEYRRLRRSFLMLVSCICGYDDLDNLPAVDTLAEVAIMIESLPEKARKEGIAQGEVNILLRQLTKKFGRLTDAQMALLGSMTLEQLETIGDNIFDATDVDALIQYD